jgi:hypothetical protein
MRTLFLVSPVFLLLIVAADVQARLVTGPTEPAELVAQSDLVVIGDAIESKSTKDKTPTGFDGVNTRIEVQAVLKGDLKGKELVIFHYRFSRDSNQRFAPNGPDLVVFKSDADKGAIGPHYLLFLKKLPDGRYEATSGQIDPIFSVRRLILANEELASDRLIPFYGFNKPATQPTTQPTEAEKKK